MTLVITPASSGGGGTHEAPIVPTLLNSWVNYDAATRPVVEYWKTRFNELVCRGWIKNGTIGAAAFSLPAGYRIAGPQLDIISTVSNSVFGYWQVYANGDATPQVGNNAWFVIPQTPLRLP